MAGHLMPPRWMERARPFLAGLDALLGGRGERAVSARIALFAFSVRVVSAIIAFVSQVLLARWMGAFEYGIFVFVLVASVILGGLSCLGFQTAVIRFAPEYRATGRLELLRGLLLASRLFAVAVASFVAGLGLLALRLAPDAVPDYYVLPLVIGAFCLPVMALGEVLDGTSRAHAFAKLALLPTFIVRPLLLLLFMEVATGPLGYGASAVTATGCLLAATWATTAVQLLLVGRNAARAAGPGSRAMAFRTWVAVALPIFLVEGFFNLLTNVDILMVGHFMTPADVAVYYASVKTLALVHFVYFAVKASAAQRFSQYLHAGDRARYDAFVRETIAWTFWPSLAVAGAMLVGGELLLGLFGPDFETGFPLLFVLVAGVLARASVGPAESVLTMSGEQKACAGVYVATIVVNIALNILLIPALGLFGAALATSSAMIFEALALHAMARRRLGLVLFVFARQVRVPSRTADPAECDR
ncbi:lipopolysaccharide biosynthesis protein [Aureimonas sp. Leaf454]|uniref:lipopolysaccharide biosynthesis protein n=1 Tax=Aureimonas sp. Leaf454 TaxID=1736381 RepID=UPI000AEC5D7E|nr:lipopolysaccharide biosynthesis protein [Aureimonas sp. Leaf454]